MPAWSFISLTAALLALGSGCRDGAPASETPASATHPKLNVVFVSVDTTRADHLGCYGHPEAQTPHIDRLAAEGTRFRQCLSSAPVTLPAHASMLTGSYQFVHGARSNGTFRVAPENTSLAEIAQQNGYATGAEVAASVLGRLYGLDQGFEEFGDLLDADDDERIQQTYLVERNAATITDHGIDFLQRNQSRPFFLFLHYYDPHDPYAPPEPYRSRFSNPYLGEIAYFDEHFGRLMQAIRDTDLATKTLVILTSDHGEGLGQHQEPTHAYFLYDATLRVPLIAWAPQWIPAGKVIDEQVRLIDIAPTVVDLLGWQPTPEMQGASLLPLLDGRAVDWDGVGYADTYYPAVVFGLAQLRCLRTNEWKYIHAPTPELYDLRNDPGELHNLAADQPARVAAMRDQLRDLIRDAPTRPAPGTGRIAMNEEQRRKLEALGYIGGGEAEDVIAADENELDNFDATAPELKDRIEVLQLNSAGTRLASQGRWEEAAERFEALLESAPQSGAAYIQLARARAELQQFDLALKHYQQAAALQPNDALPPYSIGEILAFQERHAAAEAAFRQAIAIDPAWVAPYAELGRVLMRTGRFDKAVGVLEQAVAAADYDQSIRVRLARALLAAGQSDAAEAQLRTACQRDPELAAARLWLGVRLLQTNRADEGIQLLKAAQRLAPDDARPADNLARYYMLRNELDTAIDYYRKAAELAPKQPLRLHNLATCLRQAGRTDEAFENYERALRMNPSLRDSLTALLAICSETGRMDDGLRACRSTLADAPSDQRTVLVAADFLDRGGAHAEALAAVREALTRAPESPELLAACAWRLATSPDPSLHDAEEAIRLAEQASTLANPPRPRLLRILATSYHAAERTVEAIDAAERALALARESNAATLVATLESELARYRQQSGSRKP